MTRFQRFEDWLDRVVTVIVRHGKTECHDCGEFKPKGMPCRCWKDRPLPKPPLGYAWHTEDHLADRSATTYDPLVASAWRSKGWKVTTMYRKETRHEH